MKTLLIPALLCAGLSTHASAAESSGFALGAGYGFADHGMLTLRGDFDLAGALHGAPVTARVSLDQYASDHYSYRWNYSVVTAGAYYDFNKAAHLGRLHPFAGAGIGVGSVSCSSCPGGLDAPSVGGLYLIGGVQYAIDQHLRLEASLNTWGGPTIGLNYRF